MPGREAMLVTPSTYFFIYLKKKKAIIYLSQIILNPNTSYVAIGPSLPTAKDSLYLTV